jgi:hypothetical protein
MATGFLVLCFAAGLLVPKALGARVREPELGETSAPEPEPAQA